MSKIERVRNAQKDRSRDIASIQRGYSGSSISEMFGKVGTLNVPEGIKEVRSKAREVGTTLPKIVEQMADYQRSGEIASKHNGTRIRLERLPQLLNDPEFVESIECTESYKKNGYTWFWTDTVGTNLSGYYRINPQGNTLDEMFKFISKDFDSKVQAVPFNESAYFWKGNQPLSVDVRGSVVSGRLYVSGSYGLDDAAPVVVVEQNQAQASGRAQAAQRTEVHGVVVPTEKYDAAKEAFRKA